MNIVLIIATCISYTHFIVALFIMWRLLCVLVAAGIGHKMHRLVVNHAFPACRLPPYFLPLHS